MYKLHLKTILALNKSHTLYGAITHPQTIIRGFFSFCVVVVKHTHTHSQRKGCGQVCCEASFSAFTGDNGSVCTTHGWQQSTEQLFEETLSHGHGGLAAVHHSVHPFIKVSHQRPFLLIFFVCFLQTCFVQTMLIVESLTFLERMQIIRQLSCQIYCKIKLCWGKKNQVQDVLVKPQKMLLSRSQSNNKMSHSVCSYWTSVTPFFSCSLFRSCNCKSSLLHLTPGLCCTTSLRPAWL